MKLLACTFWSVSLVQCCVPTFRTVMFLPLEVVQGRYWGVCLCVCVSEESPSPSSLKISPPQELTKQHKTLSNVLAQAIQRLNSIYPTHGRLECIRALVSAFPTTASNEFSPSCTAKNRETLLSFNIQCTGLKASFQIHSFRFNTSSCNNL